MKMLFVICILLISGCTTEFDAKTMSFGMKVTPELKDATIYSSADMQVFKVQSLYTLYIISHNDTIKYITYDSEETHNLIDINKDSALNSITNQISNKCICK